MIAERSRKTPSTVIPTSRNGSRTSHERVDDQREERERPAEDEEQQPDEEGRHAFSYGGRVGKFGPARTRKTPVARRRT
jgi:hypothetical protein